jgi:hypothetical protein
MMYFPTSVNFFEERAMSIIEANFGLKGCTIVMKLLCKLYKDGGYYLSWDEEQAAIFASRVGRDVTLQEINQIITLLLNKSFFDRAMYRKHHVLTSASIQRVWLEAVKRRKHKPKDFPYMLVEPEMKDLFATKKLTNENVDNEADIKTNEKNVCNFQQRKEKERKEEKRKEEKRKELSLPPQGSLSREEEAERGGDEEEDWEERGGYFESSGEDVVPTEPEPPYDPMAEAPEYALNKRTHNLDGLLMRLQEYGIRHPDEVRRILKLADYGRIGGAVWRILNATRWNSIVMPGKYLLAVLAKELHKPPR